MLTATGIFLLVYSVCVAVSERHIISRGILLFWVDPLYGTEILHSVAHSEPSLPQDHCELCRI